MNKGGYSLDILRKQTSNGFSGAIFGLSACSNQVKNRAMRSSAVCRGYILPFADKRQKNASNRPSQHAPQTQTDSRSDSLQNGFAAAPIACPDRKISLQAFTTLFSDYSPKG